jgi:hypothetical protein
MSVLIKEVVSKSDLKKFIKFPFKLYSGNKFWVPPLLMDEKNNFSKEKNPAFDFCEASFWLAYKDGKVAGRIAAIINKAFNEKVDKNLVRFGYIDFIDDDDVSAALISTVEKWAKDKKASAVHGPLGFTDMDPEGMLIEGFDELGTIATTYNYAYYQHHIEKLGYAKDNDWIEFLLNPTKEIPEKIERIAEVVKQRYKLKLLQAKSSKDFLPYAHEIFEVLNAAYSNIYGFVPLTPRQIDLYVKQYFGFIKPEFVPVVLDEKNKVIAFGITMPSMSRAFQKAKGRILPFGIVHILLAMNKTDRADLYLTGVRPDYQDKGVNSILICHMNKVFAKYKIQVVESNPEMETNSKVQAQWRFYGKRQHRRRRCYIKELS